MANSTNSDKTGVSCYDGSGTYNGRTITAGSGISVADGDGVSGNPTISADADVATTYTADSGSATPAANNLNVLGGTGIDTSGSGSTLTITGSDAVPLTFTADSGSATPASNNLNIVGTNGISTSATGDTVTVDGSGLGGAWVLIDTINTTGVTEWEFTDLDSTYLTYLLRYSVNTSAGSTFYIQVSDNNGSSYYTTLYSNSRSATPAGMNISSTSSFAGGYAMLYGIGVATVTIANINGRYGIFNSASAEAATSVNAIRIKTVPNITGGSASLWGLPV